MYWVPVPFILTDTLVKTYAKVVRVIARAVYSGKGGNGKTGEDDCQKPHGCYEAVSMWFRIITV